MFVVVGFGSGERHAVVRRNDDDGVVQLAATFEFFEHRDQMTVEIFDFEAVIEHVVAHDFVVGEKSRDTVNLIDAPASQCRSRPVFVAAVRFARPHPEEPRLAVGGSVVKEIAEIGGVVYF